MEKELYLHLGFPKTGTSTLQRHVLSNNRSFLYLGKQPRLSTDASGLVNRWRQVLKRNLILKDLPYFDRYPSYVDELERQLPKEIQGYNKWLVSDEGILARCLCPQAYGRLVFNASAYEITNKLSCIQTDSLTIRVIVVIRKHADFLHSLVAQDLRLFKPYLGISSLSELADWLEGDGHGSPTDSVLDYAQFIEHCDNVLGKENVLVLPFELMVVAPGEFLRRWADFMGIESWSNPVALVGHHENRRAVSENAKQVRTKSLYKRLRRFKNRVFSNSSFGLSKSFGFMKGIARKPSIVMTESDQLRLSERYAASNRRLEQRVPGIEQYGYW